MKIEHPFSQLFPLKIFLASPVLYIDALNLLKISIKEKEEKSYEPEQFLLKEFLQATKADENHRIFNEKFIHKFFNNVKFFTM